MSTTIANSFLNILSKFSPEELEAFSVDFEKLKKPVENSSPKIVKTQPRLVTREYCINKITAKYSIQVQGKLA
jgi:hypothetical protein